MELNSLGLGMADDNSNVQSRVPDGDDAAWEALILSVSPRIFGLAYRFTHDVAEAQDLTQDVLIRLYRTIGQFNALRGDLDQWIFRLARNLLIDDYRRRVRQQTSSLEDCSGLPAPRDNLERRIEMRELVEAVLSRLTSRQREIFRSYQLFLGDKTIAVLAASLDVGVKTIEAEITRIRRVLREEHGKYYETL